MNRVMVYGTLKIGGGNYDYFLKGKSTFIDKCQIHGTMYHLGGFPAITLHGEGNIHGELFDVDDAVLANLDRLEGHPRWYLRTKVETSKGPAEVYVMNQLHGENDHRIIKDGVWPVKQPTVEEEVIEELGD